MNHKIVTTVAVVAALLGGLVGYILHSQPINVTIPAGLLGGVTTTYNTSLAQQGLYSWQTEVVNDLSNIRSMWTRSTTTASLTFPAIASSSPTVAQVTSTIVWLPSTAGDLVLVTPVTVSASTSQFAFNGQLLTAGNATSLVQIHITMASSTAGTPPASTYNVWIIPKSVQAIGVSTTSVPTNPN